MQAAEAVRHIHVNGVIHGDIGAHNFFLKQNGSIVLGDFGGSRIDGSSCRVLSSTRYTRPMILAEYALEPTHKDDMFALGGVMYEINAKKKLYEGKPDKEIRESFLRGEFPDLTRFSSNLRIAIEKCWYLEYDRAAEVIRDLSEEGSPSRRGRFEGLLSTFSGSGSSETPELSSPDVDMLN
jgi:serine/threonine protein kinase